MSNRKIRDVKERGVVAEQWPSDGEESGSRGGVGFRHEHRSQKQDRRGYMKTDTGKLVDVVLLFHGENM